MPSEPENWKITSTTKWKKFKIYSEFNNDLPKCGGENVLSHYNGYSSGNELTPKLHYKPKKSAHNLYHKSKTRKENIIDIYQRSKKLHVAMPDAKNIFLYDTKRKCYYSGFNSMRTGSYLYNYSGTDVSRLLVFMEYTNNTMQRLLKDLNTSKIHSTPPDLSTIILVINSKQLKQFFNVDKYTREKHFPSGDYVYNANDTSLLFSNVTDNTFDITIERKCIGFKISISKYSFRNLLETLSAACNLSRYFFPVYDFKIPSLCVRDWYFRNATQGHLLRLILRNVNIYTLNIMRKLYFVLITNSSSNLCIQINFILKNGIFAVDEENASNTFLPGIVNWSDGHRNILQSTTSIETWNILKKFDEKREQPLNAIKYVESMSSAISSLNNKPFQTENEELSSESLFDDYNDDSDDDYYDVYDFEDDDYDADDDTSIPFSDPVFFRSDTTINLTVNKSVQTSFIFSVDEIMREQYIEIEKKNASTLCDITLESDSCSSLLRHSKMWLSKQGTQIVDTCFNLHSKNDYINETIFDAVPGDLYVNFVNKYWKWFTCQRLHKQFFKSLAQCFVYTLFSSNIF